MRINQITNWAYGVTVILTVLSGTAFILSSRSATQEREAVQQHLTLDALAEDVALGTELRSDEARLYVMRGDERHLAGFYLKEEAEHQRDAAIKSVQQYGVTPPEQALLQQVERKAQELDQIELAAIEAYRIGNQQRAQQMLFNDEHVRLQTELLESVGQFRKMTAQRTDAALNAARERSDWLGFAARIMLTMTAAVFIGVLYFVLKRRVSVPLTRMTGIVTRLAKQDYAVEVPLDMRRDEIGEMNDAIHIFRENGLERARLDAERRQDQATKDLILQMMHRLQACQVQAELAEIVARFAPQIFPSLAGQLFMLNESRTQLSQVGSWLDPRNSTPSFALGACWGLRRGHPHVSNRGESDITCQHLEENALSGLCVPLIALGDTIGLLYFEERSGEPFDVETSRLYLELIAENVGLAAANLQLREKLTNMAIRDALTGLLNRRSLDETLNRYIREQGQHPLICLMIDIDHFKRFNDVHGHDAGDAVMQYVAQILVDTVKDAGSIYRFGGEEFTVLMPDIDHAAGFKIAEKLRTAIGTTPFSHRGRVLGHVSVSVGIASSPMGGSVATLMTRADAALLEAKSAGRNVTISSDQPKLVAKQG
ncbi:sensor domain-containing diguanylate cyclase [Corticibacterium sp. UT-5YL-CI-8]|nr:sensor domain-containing diguanylate cyclase [Tianweitania sp. UT-5YL-CI-8]